MKKLMLVALLAGATTAYADRSVDEIFPKACAVCHTAGVAGAPKAFDAAAWQPRLAAKGIDGLVQSVTNGLNAMPPRGMCMDCTPTEYKALIEHMMKAP